MIKGKRILVTGGAGSIGSEIVRQLSVSNKVFVLDNNETGFFDISQEVYCFGRVGDIRNKETIHDVFSDFKPQIVIHAAAYKHVSPMEYMPQEAVETNIMGTMNVLNEARKWECVDKFVFISTDKAVNPSSVMGATKRVGEIMVKNAGFTSVRFANVLGSRGSVIPIWQKQINRGEPLTITHPDMERYFMTIPDAVSLVIKATEETKGGEIFVLDMGDPIKIIDLAKEIIKKTGRDIKIKDIGIRKGEQLSEILMSEEEKNRATKVKDFWIIT